MKNPVENYLSKIQSSNNLRIHIRQSLAVLSLLVVLSVFWGLKLTGITMAGEAFCGLEEHVHSEDCPIRNLVCELEESEAHTHSEACLVQELVCGLEEQEPHVHTDACLTRILNCPLPEQEGHLHSDACLIRELTCGLQEQEGHSHTGSCMNTTLTCGLEEIPPHSHEGSCYQRELICSKPETDGHSHGSECFDSVLSCTLEENGEHTHDDSCMTQIQTCTLEVSEGHHHGDSCYRDTLVCTQTETAGHVHSESCYTTGTDCICGLEEVQAHFHSEVCYTIQPGYGCGQEETEAHFHSDSCFTTEEGNFCCNLEETEGHIHTDQCWRFGVGFGCGQTEAEGHIHTEECITEETEFGCGRESSPGHIHSDECYDILEYCPLEEHTHDASCYSDLTADLETSDDWELSLSGLIPSTRTAENIVMVAESQLGYTESTRNFQVDENGIRRGITRYGQWYNNPYGDWSAMFVSFCLHYAGVEDVPANAGPESMRLEWEAAGLYLPVAEYSPTVGHLLFLDKDQNGAADAVAIITEMTETGTICIEGDVEQEPVASGTEDADMAEDAVPVHIVAETAYDYEDPRILGYGLVPFAPEVMMMMAPRATTVIARTISYSSSIFEKSRQFVIYADDIYGNHYAFDGSGNAVSIHIDAQGNISTGSEDPDSLLWTVTSSGSSNSYYIQNVGTGRYLHITSDAVTTTGQNPSTIVNSGLGLKMQSNSSNYPYLDTANFRFTSTTNQNGSASFHFGYVQTHTVWLDGTNGGIMSLGGSPDVPYTVRDGNTMQLPPQWDSPEKYSYTLRGWYDVINGVYYKPGDTVTVTEDMVFYADWKASTYNIGQYNSRVADTVSTSDFVTVRMFDYGILFNVLSETVDVRVDADGHQETWTLLESGTNAYNDNETLNFIFRDWDRGGEDISYPENHNDINNPTNGGVYPGLYTPQLGSLFFDPGTEVIGKQYLGTADHLFQLCLDESHEHYGYYYYNSERNAASYNQSAGRFYVYDYLECTRTSSTNGDANGKLSDFLPLNSPYANTNGNTVNTYSYSGIEGEYNGVTHYMYDCRYNDSGNSTDYVGTNFLFGMSVNVDFYLPTAPGTPAPEGGYGNQDLYGNDMHFRFSGDDDVWIFVDGKLVLDLGGLHGYESGDINFSTGIVTVNGAQSGTIYDIGAGEHTLTLYYMERGSSMSNCAIYFNLAPRYSFSIQKEDILTQNVLNGAQFSVYTDAACTVPAQLWTSKAAHDRKEAATNTFTVTNGVANMWGMGAGNTYYIKETRAPDDPDYEGIPNGVIRISLDKTGNASYNVEIIPEENSSVTGGFTVHGFRIDEQTQDAYIIATNAPKWARETTSVQVMKHWADGLDHTEDSVTVYLTVTDPDGTVRRLQEMVLSSDNNWTGIWENLPKYGDENKTPVQYGVEEAYTPGYYSSVKTAEGSFEISKTVWSEVTTFENGKVYLLKNNSGQCLSTLQNAEDTGFMWVSQSTAVTSNLAQWRASVSGQTVRLTNLDNQTITYYYGNGNPTDFFALKQQLEDNNRKQYLTVTETGTGKTILSYNNRYLSRTMNNSSKFENISSPGNALQLTLLTEVTTNTNVPIKDAGYLITNTPLEQETSLTVRKEWDYGHLNDGTEHLELRVTVKLLANGRDTGRTVTLSLKNGWEDTFRGLPYTDSGGNVIVYTVKESWDNDDWIPEYGPVTVTAADLPTYSTTITNKNRWGMGGPELPSTGTSARMLYTLCGCGIMLGSLVLGIVSRRRRERRKE